MKRASDRNMRRRQSGMGKSSIQLIEEAFHLLRTAPIRSLWQFYFGTIPFACLLFYFWADMSRSSYADRDAGLASLVLGLAFFWKCSWQARYCRSLWQMISPDYLHIRKGWQRFRYHAAMWLFQAFALLAAVLSFILILPFGWVITAFQNCHVLGLTQDFGKTPLRKLVAGAFRNSHYDWAQNHSIWVTLGFVAFLGWLNIIATCLLPPQLLKMFFGIDTVFTLNPSALLNSSFIFGTLLVTYLVLSPLVKAVFVLRCFYTESRTTGADLLSRLSGLRKLRPPSGKTKPVAGRKSAVAALIFGMLSGAVAGQAEETLSGPARLDQAIHETMGAKKYQWKFSRKTMAGEGGQEQSWLKQQMILLAKSVEAKMDEMRDSIEKWLEAMLERWFGNRDFKAPKGPQFDPGLAKGLNSTLSIFLVVLVVVLVGWLIWFLVRQYRDGSKEEVEDSGEVLGDVDLESEDIVADQLPEDEWLKLARQQIARGEGRLAIRALFLATLANLGERGLLKIQRYKSNRDYRRELELRARQKTVLREAFAENMGLFEKAWYGLHHIREESVDHFMENYETITAEELV